MNLTEIIPILIKVSILLVVFGFGLKADWSDATYFFRHPAELVRSFIVMNVLMLIFAIAVAKFFSLHPAVKLALIVLALSPVPPFLPAKQFNAGGDKSYVYGLLASMSVVAIVAVPVLVTLTGKFFNLDLHITPILIAKVLLLTVFVPFGAGMLLHAWKRTGAEHAAKWVLIVGKLLLGVSVLFVLFSAWHAIVALIGNGTLLAIAAFAIFGLIAGHLLGGPDPDNQISLALATTSRHPAVALAVAGATFPNEKQELAAVLLYLVVCTLISVPYLIWCKHRHEPKERHHLQHGTA